MNSTECKKKELKDTMLLVQWVILGFALVSCSAEAIQYKTKAGPVQGKLNLHLVSHTHNDLGWLKTVDQYYVGSNSSIQVAAVQYILDSVISGLLENPNRKFTYVETGFFARWWREQSKKKKEIVRKLVSSGRLEFINGGWCMHDEAATLYVDMIDQTSLGHRFLMKEFGIMPQIGWQIDPFGHSALQAYLLTAQLGFDALYFGRADYQDIKNRRKQRTMEMVWRGSKSLGASAQVFTGILPHLYTPPPGFDFDIQNTESVIQDDPLIYDYNVKERVDSFVLLAREQAKQYRTNHIIWTMGEDFTYESSVTWFKQLDKLIHYVNKDGRVNAFYSNPRIYTEEKFAANESWPLKTDDFFPYADYSNAYWTGYFTSRPALKGYIRKLSGLLQAARQLEFIVGRIDKSPNTYSLEEAMAIAQHHDAVAGTSKQHVADDYAKRLWKGHEESASVMNSALMCLMSGQSNMYCGSETVEKMPIMSEIHSESQRGYASYENGHSEKSREKIKLIQCPLINISYCPASEVDLKDKNNLVIAIYNPLAWKRSEIVGIPVTHSNLHVVDSKGNTVEAQIVPIDMTSRRVRDFYTQKFSTTINPTYNIYFEASVPALGYMVYFVKITNGLSRAALTMPEDAKGQSTIDSGKIQMVFSPKTGLLKEIRDMEYQVAFPISQSLCWYNSSDGNTARGTNETSGAYIFRPNNTRCFPVGTSSQVKQSIVQGDLVSEVRYQFSPWASQVFRLYKDSKDAELEYMIGPIPIDDDLGKEVVTRFTTNIPSNKEFFTDSNGRDFIKRVRNYRTDWNLRVHEVISGNYYPLNLGIYLKDNKTELSLLVDRAVGGSSVFDGELEVMLHRRLLNDDNKGVAENLNETVCLNNNKTCEGLTIQGKLYLNIDSTEEASQWRRTKGQNLVLPLQFAFATVPDDELYQIKDPEHSAMAEGYELPLNVAIITLQVLEDKKVLLRLAHLYEVDESTKFSTPARIDLQKIFQSHKIQKITEVNLSGVKEISKIQRKNWAVEGDQGAIPKSNKKRTTNEDYMIKLMPMEIRSFLLNLE